MKLSTIPGSPDQRNQQAEQWNRHPGMVHAGARADFTDPDQVRIVIDRVEPHHLGVGSPPAVSGAVLAGLFDVAIGIVGHCHSPGPARGTVQLNMQFLRPLAGTSVIVTAHLVRAGATLVFASAEALDEVGAVCARADGIVALSAAPKAGQ